MILLVEDSEDDVFLLERAMKKAQIHLPMHHAQHGQEALDYLQGKGKYSDRETYPIPSLILLDLKMPYVHGFEVLKWIRQQPSLMNVRVVMLTASLEDKDRTRAEQLGAQGFFIKPPTPEILARIFPNGSN
ncbi:MAG TPA: response regulator [Verrucomicrobiae bacterium]|nr:response regulator [Verrucomicrobiae bacterium]